MTTGGQDNFYYHEIIKEDDKDKFVDAMRNEKNWVPTLRSNLPEGVKVIPSVWAMRRKRDLCTGKSTNGKYG
jgi:hypothetical protein